MQYIIVQTNMGSPLLCMMALYLCGVEENIVISCHLVTVILSLSHTHAGYVQMKYGPVAKSVLVEAVNDKCANCRRKKLNC